MRTFGLLFGLFLASACGGGGGSSDMAPSADLTMPSSGGSYDLLNLTSSCGHPGDPGNALGVGKFCVKTADCAGNSDAKICTNAIDPTVYFCTMFCSRTGDPNQCGDGATCQCQSAGCGCTPNACIGSDDGGMASDAASGSGDGGPVSDGATGG